MVNPMRKEDKGRHWRWWRTESHQCRQLGGEFYEISSWHITEVQVEM